MPEVVTEYVEVVVEAKGVCGNGICEPDYGEMFYNCPQDCGGLNIDSLILSCFDDDPLINQMCIMKQAPVLFYLAVILIFVTAIAMVVKIPGVKKHTSKIFKTPKMKQRSVRKKSSVGDWLKRQQSWVKRWRR